MFCPRLCVFVCNAYIIWQSCFIFNKNNELGLKRIRSPYFIDAHAECIFYTHSFWIAEAWRAALLTSSLKNLVPDQTLVCDFPHLTTGNFKGFARQISGAKLPAHHTQCTAHALRHLNGASAKHSGPWSTVFFVCPHFQLQHTHSLLFGVPCVWGPSVRTFPRLPRRDLIMDEREAGGNLKARFPTSTQDCSTLNLPLFLPPPWSPGPLVWGFLGSENSCL